MSDKLLERIAAALETLAAKATAIAAPAAAPAAGKTKADKPTPAAPGGKPASKPAAGKGAASAPPAGSAKGPGGTRTQDEVRDIVRRVVTETKDPKDKDAGKKAALNVLDEIGNVTNVGNLKPELYDAVYEACAGLLGDPDGVDDANDDPLA